MDDIEKIRKMLADRNLRAVARNTGVHVNTLYRLKYGKTGHKYETVKKIIEYLKGEKK